MKNLMQNKKLTKNKMKKTMKMKMDNFSCKMMVSDVIMNFYFNESESLTRI